MRVDVNYLNIGVTLLNFEVDVEFTDHQVSIDYSKTNSSTGSGYSAFQPSSNGQIVRIAGSNFSFGSTLICSIYFNLPAGADTDIEFFSIFQFLSYEIPNINDPNNPIVVQEVCGNETSHNSEYYDKPIYSISGNVLNLPYGVDLENVEVEAASPTNTEFDVTSSSGQFSLTGLESMEDYEVTCKKLNDDPSCGINSLDVTVIQRHIRGVEPFLSTWQYLAADVSGDELVTTLDILKIQALLLNGAGLTKKWTFIPESTYGGLGFSPWPFDEYMQFNNLSQSHSNEDFYAVKGGDVNGLGCSTPGQIRSNSDGEILIRSSRLFRVGNIQAEHGQEVLIPVFAPRFKQQSLFTLSFHLASEFLEVIEIVAPSLPNFTEKDYTIERDDQEIIDIFWFTMEERGITISPNEPILYIKASVKQSFRNIRDLIQLQYGRMDNMIFDVNASEGEPIQLRVDDFTTIPVFEQYSVDFGDIESPIEVIPNPFTNAINFSFYQRSEGNVNIKILSSTGAEVFQETYALPEGSVNLRLDRLNNLPTGSYVYQIIQEGQLASGKLLKL